MQDISKKFTTKPVVQNNNVRPSMRDWIEEFQDDFNGLLTRLRKEDKEKEKKRKEGKQQHWGRLFQCINEKKQSSQQNQPRDKAKEGVRQRKRRGRKGTLRPVSWGLLGMWIVNLQWPWKGIIASSMHNQDRGFQTALKESERASSKGSIEPVTKSLLFPMWKQERICLNLCHLMDCKK